MAGVAITRYFTAMAGFAVTSTSSTQTSGICLFACSISVTTKVLVVSHLVQPGAVKSSTRIIECSLRDAPHGTLSMKRTMSSTSLVA